MNNKLLMADADVLYIGKATSEQKEFLDSCQVGEVVVEVVHSVGVIESITLTAFLISVKNSRPNWQYEWTKRVLNADPNGALPRGFLKRAMFKPKASVSAPKEFHI
ncbi:hypothetical protein LMH73_020155 [Vibrio splendidus]|nr:hypothetical protein [Vibrio splendidus]MCC4880480.1 hypothetical protein [Vibrio splendidus]